MTISKTPMVLKLVAIVALATSILWPRYIFFPLPGLPAVNPFTLMCLALLLAVIFKMIFLEPRIQKNTQENPVSRIFIATILWIVWSFIASLLGDAPAESTTSLIRHLIYTTSFLLLFKLFDKDTKSIQSALQFVVIFGIIAIAPVIIEFLRGENPFMQYINFVGDESVSKTLLQIQSDKARDGAIRTQSVFSHPIVLGQFAAALTPICLYFILMKTGWRKFLGYIALALCVFALATSGSRSGLLGATVSIIIFIAITLNYEMKSRFGGILPLLILVLIFTLILSIFSGEISSLILGRSDLEAGSTEWRLVMLSDAIESLSSSPVWGFGHGLALEKAGIYNHLGVGTIDGMYLNVGLDYGYVGLLLFLNIPLQAILLFSKCKKSMEKDAYFIAASLIASSSAIFFVFITLSILDMLTLFWVELGLFGMLLSNKMKNTNSQINWLAHR